MKSSLVWPMDGYSSISEPDSNVSSCTGSSSPIPLDVTTPTALSASGTSASSTSDRPPGLVAEK